MLSRKFEVIFHVQADTRPGETVCIVGDCEELGDWQPENAKLLKLARKTEDSEVWSRNILLPFDAEIKYRYFIGHVIDSESEGEKNDVMVRRWETMREPRKFSVRSYCLNPEDFDSSEAVFGKYSGQEAIDKGWLTGQTEIHLRVHNSPINMWKSRHRQQKYRIRCTPIDLRYNNPDESEEEDGEVSMEWEEGEESNHELPTASAANQVLASVLNGIDDVPSEQPMFGLPYEEDAYMVFRAQTFEPEFLGYQFEFYIDDPNAGPQDICKYVGNAYILPINLRDPSGVKTVPINGLKHKPIGQLTVDYLTIKPLKDAKCDMSISYAKHWNRKRRPLDVGHRGMGSSYTRECAAVRENTIASLSEAGGHGADFVEFDVQLSSDNSVVIYHDFTVCLSLKKKGIAEMEYFEIPVQELSFTQLQMLKLDHVSEKSKSGSPSTSTDVLDPEDRQPFPTLRQCFESIDPHLGFNIEIKYAMQIQSGELEDGLKHFQERNQYLDIILSEVLKHGGDRRIVFSCFDPDICTMIRLKQNKYPVQFLCYGPTPRYSPFKDVRSADTRLSAYHAHCESYLGVNMHAEDLLRDASLLQFSKSLGLVVFVWGEDNNHKENIKRLKELGVDGVIYDRIHELKDTKENIFRMEYEEKLCLLKDVGALPNNTVVSPEPNRQSSPQN